ncbi:hypothetical protein Afil01_21430 [Actinorhabdospora filicis]|uniref:OmpR/PhoB-type domain-containing protein n=1 Tax=Actinorhabdospora filicis TaxID=1785913 RepID=A0A9W6SMK1_9ACTN|nr:AfsR/SARP family transcriptional regulator [Actinorhabdospora filicis]GLZ77336.1 hypothetical protein Afil01_21430 [Actinorhabdospora filicis]
MVRFNLLDRVHIRSDGRVIEFGAPLAATALTTLLINANRPVPTATLATAMWDDDPPPSAEANIRTHIASVRRMLRPIADVHLRTHPGAYALHVPHCAVDLHEFHWLVRHARTSPKPGPAIEAFSAALGLWAAPAFVGLSPSHGLGAILRAHEDARLDALEEMCAVRLCVGALRGLATRLRMHVAEHPLREQGWRLLMEVRHAEGDTAGALETYERMRTVLAGELGVEPGAKSREAYLKILRER